MCPLDVVFPSSSAAACWCVSVGATAGIGKVSWGGRPQEGREGRREEGGREGGREGGEGKVAKGRQWERKRGVGGKGSVTCWGSVYVQCITLSIIWCRLIAA